MKQKRRKAILLAVGTTALSFAALFVTVLVCAFAGLPRDISGVIAAAVFSAGLCAAGMELIVIPEKTDRPVRLVGAGVICLALILVPVHGLWSSVTGA